MPATNRRFAKKRVQRLNDALYPARAGFSASRQFRASKSATSPSCKPLGQYRIETLN